MTEGRGTSRLSDPLALFDAAPRRSGCEGRESLPLCYRIGTGKDQLSHFPLPKCGTPRQTRFSELDPSASSFSPLMPKASKPKSQILGSELGKKGKSSNRLYPSSNPKYGRLLRSHSMQFGQAAFLGGLRVERRKPLMLACCNRLTVTQSALEGQYFCENFGYRRCRICRRNSCHVAVRSRTFADHL